MWCPAHALHAAAHAQARNLTNAKTQLATVSKDLEFIKDCITTTEVRRFRSHTYSHALLATC